MSAHIIDPTKLRGRMMREELKSFLERYLADVRVSWPRRGSQAPPSGAARLGHGAGGAMRETPVIEK